MQADIFCEEVYDKFTFHADCSWSNCAKCNENKNTFYNDYINTAKMILSLNYWVLSVYVPGVHKKKDMIPNFVWSRKDGGYFWIGVDLMDDQRFNFDLLITKEFIKFRRVSFYGMQKLKGKLITLHEGILQTSDDLDKLLCQILSLVPKEYKLNMTSSTGDCPICFHTKDMFRFYQCTHYVCAECHEECVQHNLTTCSICRSV